MNVSGIRRAIQESHDLTLPVHVIVGETLYPIAHVTLEKDSVVIVADVPEEVDEVDDAPTEPTPAQPEPAS